MKKNERKCEIYKLTSAIPINPPHNFMGIKIRRKKNDQDKKKKKNLINGSQFKVGKLQFHE